MKAKDWRPTSFVETAPGAMGEDEADTTRIEQRGALYEYLRHLMTLDAGALVLVASLIEKVFVQPVQRAAIGFAVSAFFASLLCGSVAYLVLLVNGPRVGALRMSSSERRVAALTATTTLLGFLLGMGGLAWFFLANWSR
jgi:hypothetical protein